MGRNLPSPGSHPCLDPGLLPCLVTIPTHLGGEGSSDTSRRLWHGCVSNGLQELCLWLTAWRPHGEETEYVLRKETKNLEVMKGGTGERGAKLNKQPATVWRKDWLWVLPSGAPPTAHKPQPAVLCRCCEREDYTQRHEVVLKKDKEKKAKKERIWKIALFWIGPKKKKNHLNSATDSMFPQLSAWDWKNDLLWHHK